MQQTPCEYMLWKGIPAIRKELAATMIKQFGLSQREAAEKLGITPAAVCQYLAKKRGNTDIFNDIIIKEITMSAERIIKTGDSIVLLETCRICKIVQKTNDGSVVCKDPENDNE